MKYWGWIAAAALVGATAHADVRATEGPADGRGLAAADAARQGGRRAVQTSRETRTLAIGDNGELNLETVSGNVDVTAGGARDVSVEIVRESRGRTDADARLGLERVRAVVDVRGSRASIRAEYPREDHSPYSVSVSYRVTAPVGTQVAVKVVSGNITATGIHGDVSLDTVSGNVHVADAVQVGGLSTVSGDVTIERSNVDGPLEGRTTSGTVRATDVSAGRLSLSTVSGDVVLQQVSADALSLSSTSGNLTCTGALRPRARYELKAHSGDIRLTLSGSTGFEFEGTSFSGSIRTTPPLPRSGSDSRRPQRTVRGTFGDGSAYVSATTFSGNVTVQKE